METLATLVQREGPLAERDAVGWAIRLAKRVEELHRLGVAHGGVSAYCVLSGGKPCQSMGVMGDVRDAATRPAYHSPERHAGQGISPSDDTWGLAVTLYLLLTGTLPFAGETTPEIRHRINSVAPSPLAVFDVGDDELQRILDGFLMKDHAQRQTRVAALREALSAWANDPVIANIAPLDEGDDESIGDFDDDEENIQTVMRDFTEVRAQLAAMAAEQGKPLPDFGAPSAQPNAGAAAPAAQGGQAQGDVPAGRRPRAATSIGGFGVAPGVRGVAPGPAGAQPPARPLPAAGRPPSGGTPGPARGSGMPPKPGFGPPRPGSGPPRPGPPRPGSGPPRPGSGPPRPGSGPPPGFAGAGSGPPAVGRPAIATAPTLGRGKPPVTSAPEVTPGPPAGAPAHAGPTPIAGSPSVSAPRASDPPDLGLGGTLMVNDVNEVVPPSPRPAPAPAAGSPEARPAARAPISADQAPPPRPSGPRMAPGAPPPRQSGTGVATRSPAEDAMLGPPPDFGDDDSDDDAETMMMDMEGSDLSQAIEKALAHQGGQPGQAAPPTGGPPPGWQSNPAMVGGGHPGAANGAPQLEVTGPNRPAAPAMAGPAPHVAAPGVAAPHVAAPGVAAPHAVGPGVVGQPMAGQVPAAQAGAGARPLPPHRPASPSTMRGEKAGGGLRTALIIASVVLLLVVTAVVLLYLDRRGVINLGIGI